MSKRTVKSLSEAFKGLSTVGKLKAEIELLVRCSSDTVYRLRYDTMQYDYISPSVVHLLGYTVDELMQINMRSLILETRIVGDGMRAVESYAGLEETRKRGEVAKWQADYLMQAKEGSQVWVSDVSYPWFDEDGAIIGSVGSLRDISERIAAENKIREELLRISSNDTLTGLANRQMFWNKLEDETRRLRRTHGDVALLLIQIDRFDGIVTTYGRDMADTVVSEIAAQIDASTRDIDLAARLSGEEFGLILPETNADEAAVAAKRIRDAVARRTFFASSHNNPMGCTVSIGLASTRFGQNTDATGLYKLADMRLYIARHTGENQISAEELTGNFH